LLRASLFCFLSSFPFPSCASLEKGLGTGRPRPRCYGFGSWTGRTRKQPRNPLRRWKRGARRLFETRSSVCPILAMFETRFFVVFTNNPGQ
jgi:hypothetical protein